MNFGMDLEVVFEEKPGSNQPAHNSLPYSYHSNLLYQLSRARMRLQRTKMAQSKAFATIVRNARRY